MQKIVNFNCPCNCTIEVQISHMWRRINQHTNFPAQTSILTQYPIKWQRSLFHGKSQEQSFYSENPRDSQDHPAKKKTPTRGSHFVSQRMEAKKNVTSVAQKKSKNLKKLKAEKGASREGAPSVLGAVFPGRKLRPPGLGRWSLPSRARTHLRGERTDPHWHGRAILLFLNKNTSNIFRHNR